MIIAIVILSLLVIAETLLIFWLCGVLKNTFDIVQDLSDMAEGKIPKGYKKAYDGKYYPATVLAKIEFGSPQEMIITDFSRYEKSKIVGFTIFTKETLREHYGEEFQDLNDEEIAAIVGNKPAVFKNVIVYSPMEGGLDMEAIIIILWSAMSLLVMIQYAPYCKDLSPTDQLIVGVIFLIGGPFFTIANVLEALLDCFLPEGWDNDGGMS